MKRIPLARPAVRTAWVLALTLAACSDPPGRSDGGGVAHLAEALRAGTGAALALERVTLAGVGREAAVLGGGAAAGVAVDVPAEGRLLFAAAARGPGPVRASLRVTDRRGTEEVWTADLSGDAPWKSAIVDLAAYAGRRVELGFSADGNPAAEVLWGSPVLAGARDARRNLLLYEIDTLRADLLDTYGFPGPSSPWLGAVARRGTLFSSCIATASWTRPSAASILTSRSAPALGMTAERSLLPDDIPTLTRLLREGGWYTVAFQTNPNAGRAAALDRDFDIVFEMNALLDQRRQRIADWEGTHTLSTGSTSGSTELIAFALEELLPEWADLPLFLYIHVMDPHAPYNPRAPFSALPGLPEATANAPFPKPFLAYSRDVRAGDTFLGAILRNLEDRDVLPRTVQVFVSDHGEEFGDHGGRGHGRNLFVETLRVPFVLAGHPDVPAGRILRQRVSTLDLLPTVLELLEVPAPPGLEGRSLLPRLRDDDPGDPFPEDPAFAHVIRMKVRVDREAMQNPDVIGHLAVLQGPWKFVLEDYGEDGPGRRSLYDLRADPGELRDVAADHPERVAELERRARAWWESQRAAGAASTDPDVEVDPELQDQLRALGYVE